MHREYMNTIEIILLTLGCYATIFLASYVKLWKNPPEVNISLIVPEDLNITFPTELTLVSQKLPSKIETDKPELIPLPERILDYIELESDEWAKEVRKRRARALYRDSNNWDIVLRQLEMEDSPIPLLEGNNFNG